MREEMITMENSYNEIYLMVDEKRYYALVKPGFASDLAQRVYAYTTHNPEIRCISHVHTMKKTEKRIEEMFHAEMVRRGYEAVKAVIDNKQTEWFKVSYEDPFYEAIMEKGLCAFNCGKRRKNYGEYFKPTKRNKVGA
jgi:hypothetical protein